MGNCEVRRDGVYLDGVKTLIASGDFHYFRTLPGGWRRRLKLMKDFGLTAVTTYVAWNMHEPKRGEYCFEGQCDLPRFLRECGEEGLKVILRCSPYMCGEWEMGGLPAWLLADRRMCLRSADPAFMEAVREYFGVLGEKIRPYLYSNGGPVILAGLENEYGSYGNDREYLEKLRELYREVGIDVPLVSGNGADPYKYINGTLPESWNGIDTGANPGAMRELDALAAYQPDKPLMIGEAWVGSIMFWGKSFELDRNIESNAEFYRLALERGAAVNFYMFCGGTNFGFTAGGLRVDEGEVYTPLLTSYDYDAPISEDGVPREKYFALRDVLDKYLGKEARPHVAPEHETQSVAAFRLTECAPLFGNVDALAERTFFSRDTVCMEDAGQNFGFIRYTAKLNYTDGNVRHLCLDGLADRATVYLDGKYIGQMTRDGESDDIAFRVPEGGAELSILVENMGRVDYGYNVYDRKGLNGCVHFRIDLPDGSKLYNFAKTIGFRIDTLPLETTEGLRYGCADGAVSDGAPMFWRGKFSAKAGVDTFLDMKGWDKGVAYLNGFNLGRYWRVGPQRTLYVPGELVKDENTLEIFELHKPEKDRTARFIDRAILTELETEDRSLDGFELK